MGKVYQSVRGLVHGTLHRRKPDIMVSTRAKGNDGRLNDELEELEKIFVDGIGRLKAAVSDHQAVVASEAQHAEQLNERRIDMPRVALDRWMCGGICCDWRRRLYRVFEPAHGCTQRR